MNPDLLVLGGALLSGLMGGAHCAAMCGGIATGFSTLRMQGSWLAALQPNLGRIGGYTVAGAVAGGLGHGIVTVVQQPGLALALRAAVGVVLILAALRLLDSRGRLSFLAAPARVGYQLLRPLQRHLLPADTVSRRIAAGFLWGWLPCGLSATVLTAAWLQASAAQGAMTMLAFGIGTLPVMVPLTWSGARLGQWLQRSAMRTTAGLVVLLAGVLTLAAPWLTRVPAVHAVLTSLGCRSLSG
jgi:sulfite exporter TauE/SafE